jgi:starch-binding outer membrane protein, SusD/RagB family
MTLTHRSLNLPRALRIAAGVCALVMTSSCMDLTNVPNYDNESLDALVNDPTPARIATAAQGLQRSLRVNFAGGFSYLSLTAWRGREGFNLDPATPGLVPTNLTGPIGPEGDNFWTEGYRTIQLGNVILTGVDKVTSYTNAQKEATKGFVKTIQAHAFHLLILVHDSSGAVLATDVDPSAGPAAPIAGRAAVYARITALLDEAKVHLVAAGTTAFPFQLSSGFAGFTTPATFIKFNRALQARVDIHRSTLLGENRWAQALTALGESFEDTAAALTLGVYNAFSTASGDVSNTSYDPTGRALVGHPSYETKAQLRADLTKDLRYTTKFKKRATPISQSNVSSDQIMTVFTSNNSPIPIVRNEDLILLKAEALLATGDRPGALAHINFIRRNAGGLANTTDTGNPGLMNELIYNRRYSLFYEGWRWFDMRRWGQPGNVEGLPGNQNGLLGQLEQDRPENRIFRWTPLPLAECTARDPKPAGCAPEAGVTGTPYP